jgi:hypothetical protein
MQINYWGANTNRQNYYEIFCIYQVLEKKIYTDKRWYDAFPIQNSL